MSQGHAHVLMTGTFSYECQDLWGFKAGQEPQKREHVEVRLYNNPNRFTKTSRAAGLRFLKRKMNLKYL